MADQPEAATTTAARVLPLSEAVDLLRKDLAVVEPFGDFAGIYVAARPLRLVLDALDAATERAVDAERLHAAAWQHIQISERYLGGEVEKERQARERAERDAHARGVMEMGRDCNALVVAMRERAEQAEAALATERGRADKVCVDGPHCQFPPHALLWRVLAPSSQAAPHEPPQKGDG